MVNLHFSSEFQALVITINYFLDISLNIEVNKIIIDWFHKEISSECYLSFYSNHPKYQTIGTICSLIDRSILLFYPSFYSKNIELCINMLLDNFLTYFCNSLGFIFDIINRRLKNKINIHHNKIEGNKKETIKKRVYGGSLCYRYLLEVATSFINRSTTTIARFSKFK